MGKGNNLFLALVLLVWGCSSAPPDSPWVTIPGGTYVLGAKNHYMNPRREAFIATFQINQYEVTNAEFAAFVEATGYVTVPERRRHANVFHPGLAEFRWESDSTAYWRFPNGIHRVGIEGKMDHPVTTIAFEDALAYCEWAKVRLPTLDEWEVACRGGKRDPFFWGQDIDSIYHYANVWHGRDHLVADTGDAWVLTAPVGSFPPNPFGLYDIYGNIFEFCANRPEAIADHTELACARGGSWWCSRSACNFFNSVDIGRVSRYAAFSNQGFRVARDISEKK